MGNAGSYMPLVLALVLVLGMLIGVNLVNVESNRSFVIQSRHDKISNILSFIEEKYVDPVDMEEIVESTIPSILNNLDPHSIYIPAKDLQQVTEPLEGRFEGIGIQFNMLNDTVVVIQTIPGGPSERIGILPGDRIVKINDTVIAGVNMEDEKIVTRLRGPKGSTVDVSVFRPNFPGLFEFSIKREEIPLYSIDVSYMIDEETGYIKISQFAKTTFREYIEAIEKLKRQGLSKLIIDLRGNSGGYMDPATNIADQFLDGGDLIVYTEGRSMPRRDIKATSRGVNLDTEVIIIIDEWSASASEILAGAIQDNDRGTIVGRRSFGKGLVQEPAMLSDGSALRLTVARYYTPTGRSIQKPYDNGTQDYFNDLQERFMHGEYYYADSIEFADSLKFFTPEGKVVYGGGGIMPDVFIPRDTTGITNYFADVSRAGLIYRFALNYADRNRERLSDYSTAEEINEYLNTNYDLLEQFISFAEQEGVQRNEEEIELSGKIIHTRIKAYIARNIIDNEGFYPIIEEIDNTLQESIKLLSGKK